jgi:hypothetical protein
VWRLIDPYFNKVVGRWHSNDPDSDETKDDSTFTCALERQRRVSISVFFVFVIAVLHNPSVLSVVVVVVLLGHCPFKETKDGAGASSILLLYLLYNSRLAISFRRLAPQWATNPRQPRPQWLWLWLRLSLIAL